eukprot:scaffold24302_cov137-Cylindrotheca_fusiformis.AAC.3
MRHPEWIELCEVSQSIFEIQSNHQDHALHLLLEDNPFGSLVVQAIEDDSIDHNDPTILIHPVMFDFLSQSIEVLGHSEQREPIRDSNDGKHKIYVKLGPLPIEPTSAEVTTENDVSSSWRISPIKIVEIQGQCQIHLSCIFMHPDIVDRINEGAIDCERLFMLSLQGRLLKEDAVILVWTCYGFAIFQVCSVNVLGALEGPRTNVAYRINNSFDKMTLGIDLPISSISKPVRTTTSVASFRRIPGYEEQLEEILATLRIQNAAAAPSGILLTGPTGVGKSRMAGCIAFHYEQGGNTVCFLSVQELIFRALTETDLLADYVAPLLEGCTLCILDDLHLLEVGDSDELQRDIEYTIVQNTIIHLIDQHKDGFRIVGISQAQSRLPLEFTKIGRLEKTFNMVAPTQLQRESIWESFLTSDAIESEIRIWANALASATAGCVAEDLVGVYQDARTRAVKISQSDGPNGISWGSLREAAYACIPSQLADLDVVKPRVQIGDNCWNDFAGYNAVKKSLFRNVITPWRRFLRNMDQPHTSHWSWLQPPSGVLFHGPSGCGKTRIAVCLACSLGLPMIRVRASDVLDKWLGGSEALLRSLFARARAASPCILFLDEIDSIASNREEDDVDDLSSRILSTLLNEMDGVSNSVESSRVLVIACTNRFKSLDSALLRPGRLQEHFFLGMPTFDDLCEILQLRMKNIPQADSVALVDIAGDLLARNATGADVEGFCREVCFMASRRCENPDEVVVTRAEIDCAIKDVSKSQGFKE